MRTALWVSIFAASLFLGGARAMSGGHFGSQNSKLENEVDVIVSPLVDRRLPADQRYVGVWVGLVSPGGEVQKGYGSVDLTSARVPESEMIYEIGSITKAFTGVLAAQAVSEARVELESPAASFLSGAVLPQKGEMPIRVRSLLTHTSGLPRLPTNLNPADPMQPYAEYDEKNLLEFLRGHELTRGPGDAYEYSNLGAGLLGLLLEKTFEAESFEALVRERIAKPLEMSDTGINLSDEQRARLVQGHNWDGTPVPGWFWDSRSVLAPTGALRASGTDMLRFLKANLKPPQTPIGRALQESQTALFARDDFESVGYFWEIDRRQNIIWHNGATFGFHSFLGFDPRSGVGVVILANTMLLNKEKTDVDPRIDVAGFRILNRVRSLLGAHRGSSNERPFTSN